MALTKLVFTFPNSQRAQQFAAGFFWRATSTA
jgi:hypothetical protein